MRIIDARIHGYLDLLLVAIFLLGPLVLGLGGTPAALSYTLALVHLLVTLLTRFPLGAKKVIPFVAHGLLELAVGAALLALPSFLGFGPGSPARRFYLFAGVLILVIWVLTDYRDREPQRG